MIIREAKETDFNEILNLFEKLQVNLKDSHDKPGFFKYSKSCEELMDFLSPYFFVAEHEGKIKGFNLAYDFSLFKSKFSENSNLEKQFISQNISGNFVYVDSFAVKDYSKLISGRITENLFNHLMKLAKIDNISKIIGCICHEPYYDVKSVNYFSKKGFKLLEEINVEDEIILGIYQKFLKN